MRIELFDHLLLLAAIVCAATLVRLLRGNAGLGRGYALVVGGGLVTTVMAMGGDRFVGVVALALVVLTVLVPWALEQLSRAAFARGRLGWVARLSSWRAMLMPGAGLSRQLPILDGLALLDREGVDAALAHFRRLADEAEEPGELAVIHEQIVAMLFHDGRWDEGIAHYERRFHRGYAALRPNLALGLLRAYGEAGRLERAAGLLRALEDGPVGADPGAAELLGQARLTFLAYAGAVGPIEELVERRRFGALGLTPATAELFKGIALARAGADRQAIESLTRVESLAGPRDHRVLETARAVLIALRGGRGEGPWTAAALAPELRGYVDAVSQRLREFLLVAPDARPQRRPRVTYATMVGLALVYGVHLLRGGGGLGLLELGAMSEDLWRAGSWGRVFTSVWIHVDLVGLLFDAYAIWLAGQLVERMLGSARMAWATVIAAYAGVAASVLSLPLLWDAGLDALAIVGPTGGSLMAVGASTAGMWMLLPSRTPQLSARARRNLAVTLALLLIVNLLTTWPGLVGFGVAPVAIVVTVLVATATALALPRELPTAVNRALAVVVGAGLLVNVAAFVLVAREDPESFLVDHRAQRCELGGVVVRTPIGAAPMTLDREVPFELPIVDGLLDTLALRDGALVQVAVYRGELDPTRPALFAQVEELGVELSATAPGPLPEPFAELIAAQTSWRAWDLWRNGVRVGRVIEHQLPTADPLAEPQGGVQEQAGEPATVMVLASPAEALGYGAAVYAAMLRDAQLEPSAAARPRCQVE